jgi:hypothetical protein
MLGKAAQPDVLSEEERARLDEIFGDSSRRDRFLATLFDWLNNDLSGCQHGASEMHSYSHTAGCRVRWERIGLLDL